MSVINTHFKIAPGSILLFLNGSACLVVQYPMWRDMKHGVFASITFWPVNENRSRPFDTIINAAAAAAALVHCTNSLCCGDFPLIPQTGQGKFVLIFIDHT